MGVNIIGYSLIGIYVCIAVAFLVTVIYKFCYTRNL